MGYWTMHWTSTLNSYLNDPNVWNMYININYQLSIFMIYIDGKPQYHINYVIYGIICFFFNILISISTIKYQLSIVLRNWRILDNPNIIDIKWANHRTIHGDFPVPSLIAGKYGWLLPLQRNVYNVFVCIYIISLCVYLCTYVHIYIYICICICIYIWQ